jgi:hypothetical protein
MGQQHSQRLVAVMFSHSPDDKAPLVSTQITGNPISARALKSQCDSARLPIQSF